MKYVEQTVEEIQPDGSIALRKVLVPVMTKSDFPPPTDEFGTIIQIWQDPDTD